MWFAPSDVGECCACLRIRSLFGRERSSLVVAVSGGGCIGQAGKGMSECWDSGGGETFWTQQVAPCQVELARPEPATGGPGERPFTHSLAGWLSHCQEHAWAMLECMYVSSVEDGRRRPCVLDRDLFDQILAAAWFLCFVCACACVFWAVCSLVLGRLVLCGVVRLVEQVRLTPVPVTCRCLASSHGRGPKTWRSREESIPSCSPGCPCKGPSTPLRLSSS